jgi:hypothetical protein
VKKADSHILCGAIDVARAGDFEEAVAMLVRAGWAEGDACETLFIATSRDPGYWAGKI